MKKLLIIILITACLSGLFVPAIIHADTTSTTDTTPSIWHYMVHPIEAAQTIYAATKKAGGTVQCAVSPVCLAQLIFASVLQWAGNIVLTLFSQGLWLAGIILNLSILTFVVNMKGVIGNLTVVFTVWQTVRDLANMFFIFILLYIAIATIINAETQYKKLLTNVVIMALFINFSFFATGLMIDASNILAYQFYKGFSNSSCVGGSPGVLGQAGDVIISNTCMTAQIVQALKLQTLYRGDMASSTTIMGQAASLANAASFFVPGSPGQMSQIAKLIIAVIMGSILMIIISIVFISSAILLFYRFVELIFLLMLSPLAFAFWILPSTKKYFNEWWEKLITQLIFAPVYFMFLWIIMSVITTQNADHVGILSAVLHVGPDTSWASLFTGGDLLERFGLIANYVIVIMMMWYALALSKRLGASGSEQAMKAANNMKGWVGRNTVGRLASRVGNSETMRNFRQANPMIGKLAQNTVLSGAKYDFGGAKGGWEGAQKKFIEDEEKFAKTLGPDVVKVEKAEVELEAADKAHNAEKGNIEARFKTDEDRLEADYNAAEERVKEAEKANVNYKGLAAGTPEGIAKKQELDTSKKALADMNIEQKRKDITAAKESAVRSSASYANLQKAQGTVDQLKGIKQEDAEERATKQVMSDAKIKGWDPQKDQEKITQAIKDMTKKLVDSNEGVAKINQKEFSKNIKEGFHFTTSKVTDVVAATNIRKLYKEKTKKEKALDVLEQYLKPEEKKDDGDKKGSDKKDGKEEKSKS